MIYLADGTVHHNSINQHLMELTAATVKRMEIILRDSYVENFKLVGPKLYDADGLLIQTKGIKIGQTVKIKLPPKYTRK